MSGLGTVLVGVAMAVGVAGTVLPLVPGILLVWAAALVYGLVDGFDAVAIVAFVVITLLAIAGKVASWVLPGKSGAAAGAPLSTLAAGAVGAVIGAFALPVVGLIIGGVAGIFLAERVRVGDSRLAWATSKAVLLGFGIATAAEIGAALMMAVVWLLWVLGG